MVVAGGIVYWSLSPNFYRGVKMMLRGFNLLCFKSFAVRNQESHISIPSLEGCVTMLKCWASPFVVINYLMLKKKRLSVFIAQITKWFAGLILILATSLNLLFISHKYINIYIHIYINQRSWCEGNFLFVYTRPSLHTVFCNVNFLQNISKTPIPMSSLRVKVLLKIIFMHCMNLYCCIYSRRI